MIYLIAYAVSVPLAYVVIRVATKKGWPNEKWTLGDRRDTMLLSLLGPLALALGIIGYLAKCVDWSKEARW